MLYMQQVLHVVKTFKGWCSNEVRVHDRAGGGV